MSKIKKALDEIKLTENPEIDLVDKSIVSFDEVSNLCELILSLL